jgi:large subunit ribosomal protein L6
MVKVDRVVHRIEIPDGTSVSTEEDGTVTVNSDGTSLSRCFAHPNVNIVLEGEDDLSVEVELPRRKEKALAGTWAAHLRNMVKGVNEGFEYRMKAVYSHFPMNIQVKGDKLMINNLFGEKIPRQAKLVWSPAQVTVEVQNKVEVIVSGADKEKVGQTAANIERACRIRRRDRRVFQDGIYLVSRN